MLFGSCWWQSGIDFKKLSKLIIVSKQLKYRLNFMEDFIMGIFSRLIGLGLMAGTAAAAVLVGKKYIENKEQAKLEAENVINLDSIENAAAVSSGNKVVDDVKKAAVEVFDDAKTVVMKKAEDAGVNTQELSGTLSEASKAIADAGKIVVGKVYEKTPDVVTSIKSTVDGIMGTASQKSYVEPIDSSAQILNDEVEEILAVAQEQAQVTEIVNEVEKTAAQKPVKNAAEKPANNAFDANETKPENQLK